ncbi:MAG TPA: hypothetical protein DIT13_07370 [Verrucomicrobiales bacterium]|nr:hypothetical protein [Verrucomicrobiales bacterium]HRK15555.1 autotransporter-associated beta strand repeat-containing protein [Prosthecobacter sp.]
MTTSPFTPTPRLLATAPLLASFLLLGQTHATAATIQWTGTDSALWAAGANWSGGSAPVAVDDIVFGSPVPGTGPIITLASGSLANRLWVRDDYTLSGGDVSLTAGSIEVNLGNTLTLDSLLAGSAGLSKTRGGTVRLTNNSNSYTGITSIANGTLVISHPTQLGSDPSAVVISESNTAAGSNSIIGFYGGSLVLDGSLGGMNFTRDVHLQGSGPIADRGGALISIGDNTLSGALRMADGASPRSSRILSNNGTLMLSGGLNAAGTPGTHISSLGGVNTAGAGGSFVLTGELTGSGTLQKQGAGTLVLTPSSTAGFEGRLRISGSATGGQSSVRVFAGDVFGTANSGNASAPIDMNGGVLEIHSDSGLDIAKNVYNRASSTYFFAPAIGGDGINGNVTFGTLRAAANTTATFNSRNGFGATFGTQSMESSNNNSTFTNNMGGPLVFTGNFWNNSDGSARTLTISGSGNTVIQGSINTSGAGEKTITKTNNGVLTLNGTATSLNGNVNISGGAVAVRDFRALNNASPGIVNIGSGGTAGALIIGTSAPADSEGLRTTRTINLASTTGAPSIYANQSGLHPVVLAGAFTTTGGSATQSKTLVLGGTNTADNIIHGGISNQAAATTGAVSLLKSGPGTWVLAGENTYTGTTTISNGTLKLRANAPASTVLGAANNITFGANNSYAGGTLEFAGQAGQSNMQSLGVMAYSAGSNTLRVTPGAGGTASLVIDRLNTTGGSTLNIVGADFVSNLVTFTTINGSVGSDGILTRSVYWNGADFAFREGGVARAPVYGVDVGMVTSDTELAAGNNQITGSFATGSISVSTLKILGSRTLTINDGATLTLSGGGLLATHGSSTVTGGTLALGSQTLVARVNESADQLAIESVVTGTGGFTKSGAGTLILSGASTRTGTTSIDEGVLRLAGSGVLSGANATTNIRQGAVLDLNGVGTGTSIGQFNNNGVVTNSSATSATIQLGNNNGTGTSFGSIQDGAGAIHVTKVGNGAQSWLGLSTYSGATTIGGTGLVTVDVLADGGLASGIGASSNDASNLVFDGSTGGLSYRGNLVNGILNLGSTSASTNRLFTVSGSGVTLGSTPTTNLNNAIIWSNDGAIVHGTNADRTITFTGTSQGFNTFNPQITDSTGFATSVTKVGTGIWRLGNSANTYSGATMITQGILMAVDGQGLSSGSNLVFDGGALYSSGALNRNIGTGLGEMRFAAPAANTAQFAGGFLGGDEKLTVNWAGTPEWGVTAGFLDTRNGLILNGSQARAQGATGSIALSEVEIAGDFSLGTAAGATFGPGHSYTLAQNSATVTVASTAGLAVGQSFTGTNVPSGAYIVSILSATQFQMSANTANSSGIAGNYTNGEINDGHLRAIRVDDNGNTGADFATISGAISAGDAVTGIRKVGVGVLRLTGGNVYSGETNVNQGTLAVLSLGHSGDAASTPTSVGVSGVAFDNTNAITLGNGGTGAGILQYLGAGETSDRKIRFDTTTGSTQIHADGSGALILTNVANDVITATGNKTLFLRGTNAEGNKITSQLSDNGGTLGVTVDGGATWILTNPANNYTGLTTAGGGALGIADPGAIGSGALRLANGSVFAFGGDMTITNAVEQTNNTTGAFIGDHSLTFTNAYALLSTTSNPSVTTNNILPGGVLTFGGVTADSITANRTWTIEGNGETVINGDITTSTAFGLSIVKTGNGVLQLNGAGSNFNQNNTNLDIDRGTVRSGANEIIPHGAGFGNLIISPELANGDTATLDLNGFNETVNGLTSTTDGTAVIDNTASGDATLTFGANDAAVNFGTGAGIYSITDTGSGKLSLVKTGAGVANLGGGSGTTTLDYSGTTAIEAGTLNASAPLTATTGITVAGGATLNLYNSTAENLTGLNTLSLGAGAGMTILGMELGAITSASDRLAAVGAATTANTIQINIVGLAGFGSAASYDLISAGSGLSGAAYELNHMPGGFTYSLTTSDTLVQLGLAAIAAGDLYWQGDLSGSWAQLSGSNSNFSTDAAGTLDSGGSPGSANTVIFSSTAASGPSLATTLDNHYFINDLKFASAPAGVTSVSIAPGFSSAFGLTLAPSASTDGIDVGDNAGAVAISAPVLLGAEQTWTVAGTGANGSSLLVSGALSGAFNLTKAGDGVLTLSANNDLYLGTTTISAGTLTIGAGAGAGSIGAGNVVNNGALVYNRTGTFTVSNLISGTGTLTKSASGVMILNNDANSFAGDVTITAGTLAFTTVSNIGGPASSLGQGGAIHMTGGTLRFDGDSVSQTTDRPVFTSTANSTLSLNGTNGASMTYAGAITVGIDTSGNRLILAGTAGSAGAITGGFTMTGTAADALVSGGTWTLSGMQNTVADNMTVQGTSTILNLGSTGVLRFLSGAASGDLNINNGSTVNIGADNAVDMTIPYRLFIGQSAGGEPGILNLGAFDLESGRFILGERAADRSGIVNGTGTLTVLLGDIDLYAGEINANFASTGTATLEKFGPGTVTFRGDNSGLAATGRTILNEGLLVLDYSLSNTTKLREGSQLEMIGGDLTLTGNGSASTSQTVASFSLDGSATADNGGANRVTLSPGSGQEIVLNLGAITRTNANRDGTVRFVLPSGVQSDTHGVTTTTGLTNGLLGSSGFATVEDGTGTWFATKSGNNIVALVSSAKNDLSIWAAGDHITDETTGFSGTLSRAAINSLRFDASGGSNLGVSPLGALHIASGGLLVTSSVDAGESSVFGGNLTSGTSEIIVTQDSGRVFEISSSIITNHAFTKSGEGVVLLSGYNTYTDETEILQGTLVAGGGNAIGDTSIVTLALNRHSILQLAADETIGRLSGGKRATNSEYGTVAVGGHTLTLNQSANTTYAGVFTGSGSIVMNTGSTGNLNLQNNSSGFTGEVVINGGTFILSNIGQNNATTFTINKGGNLLMDNNGTTRIATRILDTSEIILNSADGGFSGATINLPRGLGMRTDQESTNTEVVGVVTANSGASYVTIEATTANDDPDLRMSDLVRNNNATINVRGTVLGLATANVQRSQFEITGASEAVFMANPANLAGGGGTAGGATLDIVPWAIGESLAGALGNTNMGNSLLTYAAGSGFRPLDFSTEYAAFSTAGDTNNTRESLSANLTGVGGRVLNSLVVNNEAVTGLEFTGSGAGQVLANTSGAFLFTLTGGADSTAYNTLFGGFDDGITVGGSEYVIHVINPSAAANAASLVATLASPLTSTADITKSGRGTLVLSAANTAGGGASKTTLNEGVLEITGLANIGGNSGGLVFAGGVLRLGAGFTDDISQRSILFLEGGGVMDTNGSDLALAGTLGSGPGGFTKTGLGNLTLNADATLTGPTTVAGGTLTLGNSNSIGSGNLAILGGAVLDVGASEVTVGRVTTSGESPVINGTGTIYSTQGFAFGHTGDTLVGAALAGPVGLTKTQNNVLALSGASTYTGITEIQAGTLSIDSMGNVAGGSSALGNPLNARQGIIRMGLTTGATTLAYTGAGHASDRLVGLQGTTGGVTLSADGTGAFELGGAVMMRGGNKTLTLRGTSDPSVENSIGALDGGTLGILSVTKSDANTWVLNGANTHTGNTTAGGGVLRAASNSAFGAGVVTLVNTDSVLEIADGIAIANDLTVSNTGNNKTLRLHGGASAGVYSGVVTIAETTAGNFDVGADTGGTLTLSGVIGGAVAGGLEKVGAGTVVLSNANTYTGITTVGAGTLLATNTTGSATGTGAVVVAPGATLGGNGFLAPAADNSVMVDGTLQIGTAGDVSARQLTITTTGAGLVTVNDIVAFDLFSGQGSGGLNDATHNDLLVVNGSSGFTIGANAQLHVTTSLPIDESWVVGTEWRLFDWTGLTGGVTGAFSNLSDPAPFNYMNLPDLSSIGLAWDVSNLYTQGTIMVMVPEPGRVLLLFLGLMGLHFRRRR